MKKLTFFVVFLVSLSFWAKAEAGILQQVGTIIGTSLSGIKIESPVGKQLGLSLEGNIISITNDRSFWARVIVYDKDVVVMAPGQSVYGTIGQKLLGLKWEPLNPEIPVLVKFYRDRSTLDRGEYLGYSNRVFSFSSSNPRPVSWSLSETTIRTPDGQSVSSGQPDEYPTASISITTREIDFPREHWNATSYVQVVNNTYFTATILLNGQKRMTIRQGEIYIFTGKEMGGFRGQSVNMQVLFTDHGQLVGSYNSRFSIPSEGIDAYQFILGPNDIRR